MKKWTLVVVGMLLSSVLLVSIALRDPMRTAVKSVASRMLEKVDIWGRHRDKFFVDQHFYFEEELLAYSEKLVYMPGERVKVFLAAATPVSVNIEHYAVSGEKPPGKNIFVPELPAPKGIYSSFRGFIGTSFLSIEIDPEIENGWIDIEVSSEGKVQNIPVFVEPSAASNILFVESTDTLKAYNSYEDFPTHYFRKNAPLGAYTRPANAPFNYDIHDYPGLRQVNCEAHLVNADLVLKRHLADEGIVFSSVSDNFLDDYDRIRQAKVLIFGAHNEYWTAEKIRNVSRFVRSGGKALFLGGNTAWRLVQRVEDFDAMFADNLLDDGHAEFAREILGAYYDYNGYATYAPYRLELAENSEDFPSVSERSGESFARGTDFSGCEAMVGGGSGHETDKLLANANADFMLLARGQNGTGSGADVVYRRFEGGGAVLNFGSVALWHRVTDEVVSGLIKDFLGPQ